MSEHKVKDKPNDNGQGPKFHVKVEDAVHEWGSSTITTEQIIALGGWAPSEGAVLVNEEDNTERPLQPGEVIELKPGMAFSKKVRFRRGLTQRLDEELELLRRHYEVDYIPEGRWVRIRCFAIPAPWAPSPTDVAFQVPVGFPGAPPYGFYTPAGIRRGGAAPQNYQDSASTQPPFGGRWGFFSWLPQEGQWRPGSTVEGGANLLLWVRSFLGRFQEGA